MENNSGSRLKSFIAHSLEKNAGFVLLFFIINAFSIITWYILKKEYLFACNFAGLIFLLTLLGSFLLSLLPEPWQDAAKKFLILITLLPWLVELFVMYNYKAMIGAGVINSMLETNAKEAWEFLKMYVGVQEVLGVAVILVLVVASFKYHLWQKLNPQGIRAKIIMSVLTVLAAVGMLTYPNAYINLFEYGLIPLQRIYLGGAMAYENMVAYHKLVNQLHNSIEITENNSKIANIVFILGESTNRNHMHLYDYYLPNTPNLDALRESKETAVFTNVVSPHSTTVAVLSKLFTFCDHESDKPWYEYNNLIDVMNAAGYKTFWLSNQESSGMWGNVAQIYAAHSAYHKFTRIRDSVEDVGILDGELFPLLDEALQNEKAEKNFFVLHLMGGHGLYYNRFPGDFKKFGANDIKLEVDERARSVVSDYDNALLYNDYIVKNIIDRFRKEEAVVIYVPDHGEAVYDEGNTTVGHIEENPNRSMIEIPMLVWASNSFKQKYPEKWAQIQAAVNQPYMTDDMIHTVMDLAGIATKEFDPQRSIFNENFNADRPRIFNNMDYDLQILVDEQFKDRD